MMSMMSSMQDTMSGFLLPAETVLKATARAKAAAEDEEEEEEEEDDEEDEEE